jgi:hypothetical protein
LREHLRRVGEQARAFARAARPLAEGEPAEARQEKEAFHEGAYWAGLLHDLGK